jgi:hypothetical protein
MKKGLRLDVIVSQGRLYGYQRPTGERVRAEPEMLKLLDQKRARTADRKDCSLGELCGAYLQTLEFTSVLAKRTRQEYKRILYMCEPLYEWPVTAFDRDLVLQLRRRIFLKHKIRTANQVLQVLSAIFSWGLLRGYVQTNPFKAVPRIKRSKANKRVAGLQETDKF